MKKLVVNFGSIIVNIVAFITIIGIIASSVMVMINQGFWAGLVSLWGGIVGFIAVFFTIYLVMSINDNLKCINGEMTPNY